MKIRSDFVTNSSSSSFILAFKDEADVEKVLTAEVSQILNELSDIATEEHLHTLEHEFKTKRITGGQASGVLVDELKYDVRYDLMDELMEERNLTYKDMWGAIKETWFNDLLRERTMKEAEVGLAKINDSTIFVLVEHGDGGYGEDGILEHHVLPKLSCTVRRNSHR